MNETDTYAVRRANLQALIDARYGGVQARLAEAIKRPSNYVWRLLSDGPHAKHIGDGMARVIEEQVGLPARWLDKPKLELHNPGVTTAPSNVSVIATGLWAGKALILSWEALENHRGPVTAVFNLEGAVVGYAYADAGLGSNAFAVVVRGADMSPDFRDGERVLLDPDVQPRAGDVVLARVDSGLLLRRYRPRGDGAGTFELVAANEDYAPIWSDRSPIEVVAVMVEHHRLRQARPQ